MWSGCNDQGKATNSFRLKAAGDCRLLFIWHIPPCQNMARGCFMVGTAHESRLIRSRCKDSWLRRHSYFGVPQASSNKLSPASRQRPGETASRDQGVIVSKQPPGTNASGRPLAEFLSFLIAGFIAKRSCVFMGLRKVLLVIISLVVVVSCWKFYLIPLFFFWHYQLVIFFVCGRLQDNFQLKLYLVFNDYSVGEEIFPKNQSK